MTLPTSRTQSSSQAGDTTGAQATSEQGTSTPRFRLGTRGSALAVLQSTTVADALRALGAEVELVTVRTLGDDRPPDTTWGEGAFVGALETALLEGSVDVAVHSAKDVPTVEPDALTIAAYPRRADPRDALVGRVPGTRLEDLPFGARVGTDSPRRTAFLRSKRPDLRVHPLHGNVDTRLRRLDDGETDALILAVAGLTRLGRSDRIGSILPADDVPPAPGQGALAVQCRASDAAAVAWLARLDDPTTRAAVEAERAFLRATGGGCRAPIGALAEVTDDELHLSAATAGIEAPTVAAGIRPVIARGEIRGPIADGVLLARRLAARLTRDLAEAACATPPSRSSRPRVLVTRPAWQAADLVRALVDRSLEALSIPTISIVPTAEREPLDEAIASLPEGAWVAVTSANAVEPVLAAARRTGVDGRALRWAAVGSRTAAKLSDGGVEVAFVGSHPDGATLAAELPLDVAATVLLPRSDIADRSTEDALNARGAKVVSVVAYRTEEGPEEARDALATAFADGGIAAIVFTSGSTVRGFTALAASQDLEAGRAALACCIGAPTAAVAAANGFRRIVTVPAPTAGAIADTIAESLRDEVSAADAPHQREEEHA